MSVASLVKDYAFQLGCVQLLGTALFIFGHKFYKNLLIISALSKNMENMPRTRIDEGVRGYVEIEGEAKTASDNLTSPLTGRTCLFWEIKILDRGKIIRVENSKAPFFIYDGSDIALVCPNKRSKFIADTRVARHDEITGETLLKIKEILPDINNQRSITNLSIIENIISVGDSIYLNANILSAPGRFSKAISNALSKMNSVELKAALLKKGGQINDVSSSKSTLSGNSLSDIELIADMTTFDQNDQKLSKYLYGSSQHAMMISTVTETMMNNDQSIDLYEISPRSIAFFSGSLLIFILGSFSLFS